MWRNTIFEEEADYVTDTYLVVGKVRERLLVSTQTAKNFDVEK
jgi:hypothetical protein